MMPLNAKYDLSDFSPKDKVSEFILAIASFTLLENLYKKSAGKKIKAATTKYIKVIKTEDTPAKGEAPYASPKIEPIKKLTIAINPAIIKPSIAKI